MDSYVKKASFTEDTCLNATQPSRSEDHSSHNPGVAVKSSEHDNRSDNICGAPFSGDDKFFGFFLLTAGGAIIGTCIATLTFPITVPVAVTGACVGFGVGAVLHYTIFFDKNKENEVVKSQQTACNKVPEDSTSPRRLKPADLKTHQNPVISGVKKQELQQDQSAKFPSKVIIKTDSESNQSPEEPESMKFPIPEIIGESPSNQPESIIRRLLACLPCFRGNEEKEPLLIPFQLKINQSNKIFLR